MADFLHEKLMIEWTYNSNAIEGNTLTLSKTKVVLEGITIGGKSDAILFLEALIGNNESLSEWNIKNIHSLILKEINQQNAGIYRMKNGYTPIIIKKENRAQYYEVVDHAHTTLDYQAFLEFVAKLVIESEQLWLSLL